MESVEQIKYLSNPLERSQSNTVWLNEICRNFLNNLDDFEIKNKLKATSGLVLTCRYFKYDGFINIKKK